MRRRLRLAVLAAAVAGAGCAGPDVAPGTARITDAAGTVTEYRVTFCAAPDEVRDDGILLSAAPTLDGDVQDSGGLLVADPASLGSGAGFAAEFPDADAAVMLFDALAVGGGPLYLDRRDEDVLIGRFRFEGDSPVAGELELTARCP